jgi:hypothetical protein
MTTTTKPHVTFTGKEISLLGEIEVTLKSGATKTVRIGEYEKCFKNNDGTESHIYSTRNI